MKRHLGFLLALPLVHLVACSSPRLGSEAAMQNGPGSEECTDGVCPLPTQEPSLAGITGDAWTATDMDGRELDLGASLASGEKVVLVFWQTWCQSCRKEFSELADAAREHDGELAFVGVISGPDQAVNDDEVRRLATALPYPQVRDRDLVLTRAYEVEGTPTIVVLGAGRRVLYRGHHLPDWAALGG